MSNNICSRTKVGPTLPPHFTAKNKEAALTPVLLWRGPLLISETWLQNTII